MALDRDQRRYIGRARKADAEHKRLTGEKTGRLPPWDAPAALKRVQEAEAAVKKATSEGGPATRAAMLDELRGAGVDAIRQLRELAQWNVGRSAPLVRLHANKAILALLDKTEAHVDDDRLRAVEAVLQERGLLPGGETGSAASLPAQSAPGASGDTP